MNFRKLSEWAIAAAAGGGTTAALTMGGGGGDVNALEMCQTGVVEYIDAADVKQVRIAAGLYEIIWPAGEQFLNPAAQVYWFEAGQERNAPIEITPSASECVQEKLRSS